MYSYGQASFINVPHRGKKKKQKVLGRNYDHAFFQTLPINIGW
jgi:hypothetical protein